MPAYLSPSELNDALTIRDLSNPDGGHHAMQALLQGVIHTLGSKWGVPERIVRHSPLVSVADNYDRLGFNESDVTRDQRYSRYVSPTVMLRSHTSASIPSLLRELDPDESNEELWVIPGLVYRRDSIDRTHVGTPHQVDLWRVSSQEDLDSGDLQEMAASLVQAVLPEAQWRAVPAVHPYTGCAGAAPHPRRSGQRLDTRGASPSRPDHDRSTGQPDPGRCVLGLARRSGQGAHRWIEHAPPEDQGQLHSQPSTMDTGKPPPCSEGSMLSSCHPSADARNVAFCDTE